MIRYPLNVRNLVAGFVLAAACGALTIYILHDMGVENVGVVHNLSTIVQDGVLAFLSCFLIFKYYRDYRIFRFRKVTFGRSTKMVAMAIVLISLAMGVKAIVTLVLARVDEDWAYHFLEYHQYRYVLAMTLTGYVCLVLAHFIFAPIAEELFFRAVLLRFLSQKYNVIVGVIVSSLLFSAVHLHHHYYSHVEICIFSVIVSITFLKYRSIWLNSLLHATNNVLAFYLEFVLNFHTSVDEATFANFGQWWIELAMLAVALPVLTLYAWRSRAFLTNPWPARGAAMPVAGSAARAA